MLVKTVTAIRSGGLLFVEPCAAWAAAQIIFGPPAEWMVITDGCKLHAARMAPATVFGISCSLRSRNNGGRIHGQNTANPTGALGNKVLKPDFNSPDVPRQCGHKATSPGYIRCIKGNKQGINRLYHTLPKTSNMTRDQSKSEKSVKQVTAPHKRIKPVTCEDGRSRCPAKSASSKICTRL